MKRCDNPRCKDLMPIGDDCRYCESCRWMKRRFEAIGIIAGMVAVHVVKWLVNHWQP